MDPTASNSYLYYVIMDDKKKIRGNLIGVEHWVEPKDQDFNPRILKAIKHSARVILEIPPNAQPPLLPPEDYSKSFKMVIKDAVQQIKPSSKVSINSKEVEQPLREIENKCAQAGNNEGYKEVVKVLDTLPSNEGKLEFLKFIQKNIFDFNLVSIERNVNKKHVEDAHKNWDALEEFNLNEKILEARSKVELRQIKEKILEGDYQKVAEGLSKIDSNKKKLEFVLEARLEVELKQIKEKMSEVGYQKVVEGLSKSDEDKSIEEGLDKVEEKLKFVNVQKSQLGIRDIEVRLSEEEMKAIKEVLDRYNLNEKILDARVKAGLRQIKDKISEDDYQKLEGSLNKIDESVVEGLNKIEEKLKFVNDQKSQLGIREEQISEEEIKVIREAQYRAWVEGDADKLRELLKVCFIVFKEEPEINQVHQSRDKAMAERIIQAVSHAKENEEDTFIMGDAHLVYKYRTNVIDYLNQHFTSDLKGWSIKQVKI